MTSMLRKLLFVTACAAATACTVEADPASPKPKAPHAEQVSALPPAEPLLKSEPLLTATAPAAPRAPSSASGASDKQEPLKGARAQDAQANPLALVEHDEPAADDERAVDPSEVKVQRFVLAHDVSGREPRGESDTFDGESKIFAFVELSNDAAPFSFRVHWEPVNGPVSPYGVVLKVGKAARYRTWSWTAIAREPGKYKAVLRTLDGKTIAEKPFTIEPSAHVLK